MIVAVKRTMEEAGRETVFMNMIGSESTVVSVTMTGEIMTENETGTGKKKGKEREAADITGIGDDKTDHCMLLSLYIISILVPRMKLFNVICLEFFNVVTVL